MTLESLVLTLQNTLINGCAQVINAKDYYHREPEKEYTEEEARLAYDRAVQTHRAKGEWS